MNILSWVLTLSFLVFLLVETVAFHKAIVCRQEAWLKSTELKTRSLLSGAKTRDRDWHLSCDLLTERNQDEVTWKRLPFPVKHTFELKLSGKL